MSEEGQGELKADRGAGVSEAGVRELTWAWDTAQPHKEVHEGREA